MVVRFAIFSMAVSFAFSFDCDVTGFDECALYAGGPPWTSDDNATSLRIRADGKLVLERSGVETWSASGGVRAISTLLLEA